MPVKPTILVVDDSPSNIDLLRELLTPRFKVKAATDGERALEIARRSPPQLILLDVVMPQPDGYAVCRRLRQTPDTRALPIILMSASNANLDLAQLAQLEVQGTLDKPIEPQQLYALIERLLAATTDPTQGVPHD